MAAQVEIPEAAMDAAMDFFREAYEPDVQHALEAAAPLIVAAELRRLAAELDRPLVCGCGGEPGGPVFGCCSACMQPEPSALTDRADALDPEGRAR